MITFSNKDYIYIGREAGKEIHSRIKNAKKSVKIVSPYLSPDYIKDIITLHKNGVKVTLITCDKIGSNSYSDFKSLDLVKEERIKEKGTEKLKRLLFKLFIGLFILSIFTGLSAFIFPSTLIFSGLILLVSIIALILSSSISDYKISYKPIFRIKVFDSTSGKNPRSTELVHSKIFVIDEEVAFLGSVNFTYSGFKTHYETTIKVEDKNAVNDISKEVESLYYSKDLKEKSVEEWLY